MGDDKLLYAGSVAAAGAVTYGIYKGGLNLAKSLDRHHRIFGGKLTDDKALESIKSAFKAAEALIDYRASSDPDTKKIRKLTEKVDERMEKMDRRVNRQRRRIDKTIRKERELADKVNRLFDQVDESPNQKRRKKALAKVDKRIAKATRAREELMGGALHVHAMVSPSLYGADPDPQRIIEEVTYDEKSIRAWMDEACAAKRSADNVWLTTPSLIKWEKLEDFTVNQLVTIAWANAQMVEIENGIKTGTDFQKQCDGFWAWLTSDKWATSNTHGKKHVWCSEDRKLMAWSLAMDAPAKPHAWFDKACDADTVVLYEKVLWFSEAEDDLKVIGWFRDDSLESAHAMLDSLVIANGESPAPEQAWAAAQVFAGNPPPVMGSY